MAKNWMFKGFLGDATPDDEIRACINQGKFMIEIAEKIKNRDLCTKQPLCSRHTTKPKKNKEWQ